MHEDFQELDPAFSARAARVVGSRYWFYSGAPPDATPEAYRDWNAARWRLRTGMEDALERARSYADLTAEERRLFDEVEAYNAKEGGAEGSQR